MSSIQQQVTSSEIKLFSSFLNRDVLLTLIFPVGYQVSKQYRLLLVNDGQDLVGMNMVSILANLSHQETIDSFVTVGIHANENRIQEYGTASQSDYANRGALAGQTTSFVLKELLPFLREQYACMDSKVVYAGFSLGGLMALDMSWQHPDIFAKVAVFSGALWWRQKALDEGYRDVDRIMHELIRKAGFKQDLQFWFQCGGKDETDDRDEDGVIDSIQDTLECIAALERKGYRWQHDIHYLELPEGTHDIQTWAQAMPSFLLWAFGKREKIDPESQSAIW